MIKVKDHLPSRPSFEKEVMDINRRAQSALKMERSKSFFYPTGDETRFESACGEILVLANDATT